jgi:hypothetical protein
MLPLNRPGELLAASRARSKTSCIEEVTVEGVGAPGATRTFEPFARATSKGPGREEDPLFLLSFFPFIDLCHKLASPPALWSLLMSSYGGSSPPWSLRRGRRMGLPSRRILFIFPGPENI